MDVVAGVRIPHRARMAIGLTLWLSILAGCGPTKLYKPDMSNFHRDRYECTQSATFRQTKVGPVAPGSPQMAAESTMEVNRDHYRMCMEARGYRVVPGFQSE